MKIKNFTMFVVFSLSSLSSWAQTPTQSPDNQRLLMLNRQAEEDARGPGSPACHDLELQHRSDYNTMLRRFNSQVDSAVRVMRQRLNNPRTARLLRNREAMRLITNADPYPMSVAGGSVDNRADTRRMLEWNSRHPDYAPLWLQAVQDDRILNTVRDVSTCPNGYIDSEGSTCRLSSFPLPDHDSMGSEFQQFDLRRREFEQRHNRTVFTRILGNINYSATSAEVRAFNSVSLRPNARDEVAVEFDASITIQLLPNGRTALVVTYGNNPQSFVRDRSPRTGNYTLHDYLDMELREENACRVSPPATASESSESTLPEAEVLNEGVGATD